MRRWLLTLLIYAIHESCRADCVVPSPTPAGPVGNPYDSETLLPFLIKQVGATSLRYQQVYNASVFTNIDRACVYITLFGFSMDRSGLPWTIDNMQINLSTTQKRAGRLSLVFSENVAADDTVVFGPGRHDFPGGGFRIPLDRPFPYDPALGNLLLDVRIFNGSGLFDMNSPALDAQNSPTDEVSSVWAASVTAGTATGANTSGLTGGIQFSPVPSLQIQVESVFGTNRPVIRWPAQPSVFVPQISAQLGTNEIWQAVTNNVGGSPDGPDRWIYLATPPPGSSGFYRLIWESGQPVQPATLPDIRATPGAASQTK